jgi:hypothetical protein
MLWSEEVTSQKGLPRPYAYPLLQHYFIKGKKFLDKKIPIPFQSKPAIDVGGLILNLKNEKIVVEQELCPYCGIYIEDKETSIRWMIEKEDFSLNKDRDWVPSDFYPFHEKCMKQARYFCPFMRTLKDDVFDLRLNKDNLNLSKVLVEKHFVIEWEKRERRK